MQLLGRARHAAQRDDPVERLDKAQIHRRLTADAHKARVAASGQSQGRRTAGTAYASQLVRAKSGDGMDTSRPMNRRWSEARGRRKLLTEEEKTGSGRRRGGAELPAVFRLPGADDWHRDLKDER
ncbi:MAG: hypothetical protein Fur0014_11050 [Rubrivivax sp.]